MGNSNKENNNKINVDIMLKRKRERNEKNKATSRKNFQARNQAIADRVYENKMDNLLGEAQIDLQMRALDADNRAYEDFNAEYEQMTAQVIEGYDAKADAEAELINSAEDVEYMVIEEVKEVKSLPPRRKRFTNTLFASETEEVKQLPSVKEESKKANRFDV